MSAVDATKLAEAASALLQKEFDARAEKIALRASVILQKNFDARAEQIAEQAAELAMSKLTDRFYKLVGKSVTERFLIVLGAFVVGFAVSKGWLHIGA